MHNTTHTEDPDIYPLPTDPVSVFDYKKGTLTYHNGFNREIRQKITKQEKQVLKALLDHPKKAVSTQDLLAVIYQGREVMPHWSGGVMRINIYNLRKKLKPLKGVAIYTINQAYELVFSE